MTGMNPARTVALTWWNVLAPAMIAIETRYTEFWIGDTCCEVCVSAWLRNRYLKAASTYNQVADDYLQYLSPEAGPAFEQPL